MVVMVPVIVVMVPMIVVVVVIMVVIMIMVPMIVVVVVIMVVIMIMMAPMVTIMLKIPLPPPPTLRLPIVVLAVGPRMAGLCRWGLHGNCGQHTKGYG